MSLYDHCSTIYCGSHCSASDWYRGWSLPPANEFWGKLIFLQACVIPSVQRRGGLHPGEGVCIQESGVCIQGGSASRGGSASSGGSASRGDLHPEDLGSPSSISDITKYGQQAGSHASYWNAFLFLVLTFWQAAAKDAVPTILGISSLTFFSCLYRLIYCTMRHWLT